MLRLDVRCTFLVSWRAHPPLYAAMSTPAHRQRLALGEELAQSRPDILHGNVTHMVTLSTDLDVHGHGIIEGRAARTSPQAVVPVRSGRHRRPSRRGSRLRHQHQVVHRDIKPATS